MESKPIKLIILCSTQRSGSTMIVDDFRRTKSLGNPEEYFIPWTNCDILDCDEYFDQILKTATTNNGVAVIKVMADQLEHINSNLNKNSEKYKNTEESKELFSSVKKLFQDAILIKIDRVNILAQAVSRYISKMTGKNHYITDGAEYQPGNNTTDIENYNQNVFFSEEDISFHIKQIAKENALWEKVIKEWGVNFSLRLTYENCIESSDYINKIYNIIDLNEDVKFSRERNVKKIGNKLNDSFINNYLNSDFRINNNSQAKEITDSEINLLRDFALYIEDEYMEKSLEIMKVASKLRPDGIFMKNKILEYMKKLEK